MCCGGIIAWNSKENGKGKGKEMVKVFLGGTPQAAEGLFKTAFYVMLLFYEKLPFYRFCRATLYVMFSFNSEASAVCAPARGLR